MILASKRQIIEYKSRERILDLCDNIVNTVSLKKAKPYMKQAAKIRYLLKALDYDESLTAQQIESILNAVVAISGMNEFPAAPVVATQTRPAILVNGREVEYFDNGTSLGEGIKSINLVGFTVTRVGNTLNITA